MIKVVRATKKDSKKILEYYVELCKQNSRFNPYNKLVKNINLACQTTVRKMFSKNNLVFKAVDDGNTVGFANVEVRS